MLDYDMAMSAYDTDVFVQKL